MYLYIVRESYDVCTIVATKFLCSSVFLDKFLEMRKKMRRRKSINLLINVY